MITIIIIIIIIMNIIMIVILMHLYACNSSYHLSGVSELFLENVIYYNSLKSPYYEPISEVTRDSSQRLT